MVGNHSRSLPRVEGVRSLLMVGGVMTTPKLPSAEEHKEALYALYTDKDGEPCWPTTPQLLEWSRAHARDVLEAAAQVADEYQDEPWGEYKNWRVSQRASREIRDKILELKEDD